LPQYEQAIQMADGHPVRIPLETTPAELTHLVEECQAVLLPGSKADVDPAKYHAARHPQTNAADPRRHSIDWELLTDAFANRKPVLGICYGLQSINVFRGGTLLQHIQSPVNHEAGRKVAVAHDISIEPGSKLAAIASTNDVHPLPVNSSHHQSADLPGSGLRVVGRCPEDSVIEALEGMDPDHFVLAVQWHPERSVAQDELSRALFRALIAAADGNTR
jgi:putative glutamine amidotransferase